MKVILTAQVTKLGKKNQVVEVKAGYARNFLFPRDLAVTANEGALQQLAFQHQKETARAAKFAAEAASVAQRLKSTTLNFRRRVSEKGQLFGSLTAKEVLAALKGETGWRFKSEQLVKFTSIKEVGDYTVKLALLPELEAHFQVKVVAE